MERHFGQKLRFILIMNGRDFVMNGKILLRNVEILLRTVDIFIMNGVDFHDKQSKFP